MAASEGTPGRRRPRCVVGEELREVAVLSAAEWAALAPGDRPDPAEYVPGLGWVCAVRPGGAGRGAGGRQR